VKPTIVIGFDSTLAQFEKGFQAIDICAEPPTPGAMQFLWDVSQHFDVAIFSHRSRQLSGRLAMQEWLREYMTPWMAGQGLGILAEDFLANIKWPIHKPPAFLSIDARAMMFTGIWPEIDTLRHFKPWNKKPG
jgi:hypothetical protein